jgi:hypothetical protein
MKIARTRKGKKREKTMFLKNVWRKFSNHPTVKLPKHIFDLIN